MLINSCTNKSNFLRLLSLLILKNALYNYSPCQYCICYPVVSSGQGLLDKIEGLLVKIEGLFKEKT